MIRRVIKKVELKYGNLAGGGRARVELWAREELPSTLSWMSMKRPSAARRRADEELLPGRGPSPSSRRRDEPRRRGFVARG